MINLTEILYLVDETKFHQQDRGWMKDVIFVILVANSCVEYARICIQFGRKSHMQYI